MGCTALCLGEENGANSSVGPGRTGQRTISGKAGWGQIGTSDRESELKAIGFDRSKASKTDQFTVFRLVYLSALMIFTNHESDF
jgi:hypothetical protein